MAIKTYFVRRKAALYIQSTAVMKKDITLTFYPKSVEFEKHYWL